MTTLKLKDNNKFIETNVCFGETETIGAYKIIGDTLYFEKVTLGRVERKFYEYALLRSAKNIEGKYLGDLVRFENHSDSIGTSLWIIRNELKLLKDP